MNVATREPVVVIDDDQSICKTLKLHFECNGYEVLTAFNAEDGMNILESVSTAIVILDIKLPDANGVELLEDIQSKAGNYYSIIITAFPDMESTVKAVQNGVGEYIYKPIDIQELDEAVQNGNEFLSNQDLSDGEFITVAHDISNFNQFVGRSNVMKSLFKTIGMVSMSKATVNITGESGTGKELIAKAIHANYKDRSEPFVSVNCSAIVGSLLESELFGHEKGSFTGAIARKEGKFSLAQNGTIFLDEIGEMDINLQAKLLRVLQEREFERVGGKDKLKANCRIISATNKDLFRMVKEGNFREDLYYRLNVVNVHVPPLRDRKEDIPDLVLYFLAKTCSESSRKIDSISTEAMAFLLEQPWAGNVRQLENIITSSVVTSRVNKLTKDVFTAILTHDESKPAPPPPQRPEQYSVADSDEYRPQSLVDMEKEQVRQALIYTNWHKGKACEILGITRPRLERKINKYGLKHLQQYNSTPSNIEHG
ncbi:Response regulator of zinc sigma-54-dependent two-component system [hydrothermal vent metagenome]|uniref:Response regulator of zinc sigma-54-dependent two-component system n=1 Tax=hydrothermal vent metagenome TaxID=652676 RepID=A0A3B1DA39_9ZZZZ